MKNFLIALFCMILAAIVFVFVVFKKETLNEIFEKKKDKVKIEIEF